MLEIFIVVFIIAVDQITKYLAVARLKPEGSIPVIKGVFHLTYIENRGAAFGILQNQRWFFIILTIAISMGIAYYLITQSHISLLLRISLCMILGGAIGNLIDRIRFGYVVDMLHFSLIDYPVFNVADSFVVIGTILLAYYLLFLDVKTESKIV